MRVGGNVAIDIPVDYDIFFFALDSLVCRNGRRRNSVDAVASDALVGAGDPRFCIDLGIESIGCPADEVASPGNDFDGCGKVVGYFHILNLRRRDAAVFKLHVAFGGCRHFLGVGDEDLIADPFPVEILFRGRIFRIRNGNGSYLVSVAIGKQIGRDGDRDIARIVVVFAGKGIVDLQTHRLSVVIAGSQIKQIGIAIVDRIGRDPLGSEIVFDLRAVHAWNKRVVFRSIGITVAEQFSDCFIDLVVIQRSGLLKGFGCQFRRRRGSTKNLNRFQFFINDIDCFFYLGSIFVPSAVFRWRFLSTRVFLRRCIFRCFRAIPGFFYGFYDRIFFCVDSDIPWHIAGEHQCD